MKIRNWPLYELYLVHLLIIIFSTFIAACCILVWYYTLDDSPPEKNFLTSGLLFGLAFYFINSGIAELLFRNQNLSFFNLTPLIPHHLIRQALRHNIVLCIGIYLILPATIFFTLRLPAAHRIIPHPLAPLNFTLASLLVSIYPMLITTRENPRPWRFFFIVWHLAELITIAWEFSRRHMNSAGRMALLAAFGALLYFFHAPVWEAFLYVQNQLIAYGPLGLFALYLFSPFTGLLNAHAGEVFGYLPLLIALFQAGLIAISLQRVMAFTFSDETKFVKFIADQVHSTSPLYRDDDDNAWQHGKEAARISPDQIAPNFETDRADLTEPVTGTYLPAIPGSLPYNETIDPIRQILRHDRFWCGAEKRSCPLWIMGLSLLAVIIYYRTFHISSRMHEQVLSFVSFWGLYGIVLFEFGYQYIFCLRVFNWSHIHRITFGQAFGLFYRNAILWRTDVNLIIIMLVIAIISPGWADVPFLLLIVFCASHTGFFMSVLCFSIMSKTGWLTWMAKASEASHALLFIIALIAWELNVQNNSPMWVTYCAIYVILTFVLLIHIAALRMADIGRNSLLTTDPRQFSSKADLYENPD